MNNKPISNHSATDTKKGGDLMRFFGILLAIVAIVTAVEPTFASGFGT